MIAIKKELLAYCEQAVQARHRTIKNTINDIEDSLFEATKSSAGDKHETERAMLQIDRERAGRQLQEIEKLQQLIKQIPITLAKSCTLGSLVLTTSGNYFLSLSVGSVTIEDTLFFCVAMDAPIAQLLRGKTQGDVFVFQGKEHTINQLV